MRCVEEDNKGMAVEVVNPDMFEVVIKGRLYFYFLGLNYRVRGSRLLRHYPSGRWRKFSA